MRKYTQMITELVRDNTGAFWSIVATCAGLSTIATGLGDYVSYNRLGSLLTDNAYIIHSLDSSAIDPNVVFGLLGDLLIVVLIALLISTLFSSFTEGGFLSYLHRGKSEKNDYVSYFFSSALGKWGRMIGATLMQWLMLIILLIAVIVISAIIFILLVFVLRSQTLHMAITMPITMIIYGFGIITALILIWFISFEAACTDGTVGKWISNSFTKAKKVFWSMFLWIIVSFVIYFALVTLASYLGNITYYLSIIVVSGITFCLTAYVFYPLYRLGTERHLNQLKINEDVRRLEERIWEEEQEKSNME